jgi:hypothetical protein
MMTAFQCLQVNGGHSPGVSPDSLLDRFAEVEGLSGSAFADFLVGDDQTANIIATITAQGSILTNIALINGLQDFLGAGTSSFGSGNIILGGDGSDIIEGKGGDDLIDGDRWLNVRISVRQNADGTGPEIATFDGMKPLIPFMLNRTYNPGQLVAVLEILPGHGGFDTANFQGPLANYTIAVNGIVAPPGTVFNVGSNDVVTVTDISAKAIDGTDRLTHIERLQFSDQAVVLTPGLNKEPVGQLTIADLNGGAVRIGDTLRVSLPGVTDADNISATNPTGAVTKVGSYVWQVELAPGTGVFSDIVLAPGRIGVGFPRADGPTLTIPITTGAAELPPPAPGVLLVPPTVNLAGLRLRVRAVYEDAHGVTEQLFSAPTDPVADSTTPPPTKVIPTGDQVTASSTGVRYIRSDLDFILDQIKTGFSDA